MPRTFRILHILRAPVGGLFRHVRDAAVEQARRGHAVGMISDSTACDALTAERLAAVEPVLELGLHRVAMSREVGPLDVAAITRVTRIAQAVRADVLHGHGAKGGAYARLAARHLARRGIAASAIYTPHGGSLHYSPASLKGRLFMTAERHLARITDGALFESAYAARVYAERVGPLSCPARVVHNGLAAEELVPVEPDADAADVVFVGELRKLKGVDVLIEALARIAAIRPIRAVIVGAGPDAEAFRSQAAAARLGDRVRFLGAMPARAAFALGRMLVMPSRAESLPYVAMEAAGAGLPLVATDVGGVGEIVAGSDTRLVPAGDAAALAAAIEAVLADPAAAAARAARLRAVIAGRFTIARMTDGLCELYGEAACGRMAASRAARSVAAG